MTVDNPPRYVPYEPPRPTPPADPRRRRVLVAVCCAWALVLLAGGVWYALAGRPTVREQTTAAGAEPTVDRALGQVINAAGTGVVPAITGYDEVTTCAITPVRPGVRYDRVVFLATRPGTESGLLDRIVAGLPHSYRPSAVHPKSGGLTAQRMSADAGDYVQINGSVDRTGLVQVTAGTGCRPRGDLPAPDPTGVPAAADRAAVQRVLDALGVASPHWSTHRLPCGVRTVEAVGVPRQALDALPVPPQPPVVERDDVYAEDPGLLVRTDGDQLTVTLTTGGCAS
ncbi:hypothetical protein [Rugosimonospora africana]|uniref:Uncharacterized protein n=1 Tax=Rugosimonospora africana TaxID=556532 RepID=A0A8J3QJX4_9ACTN|nr:hypothetical protein [Rugosimonospora africana]GIH12348.1 hypothetical protein Raf01_05200 [Rugosimonospora africana]